MEETELCSLVLFSIDGTLIDTLLLQLALRSLSPALRHAAFGAFTVTVVHTVAVRHLCFSWWFSRLQSDACWGMVRRQEDPCFQMNILTSIF